MKKYREGEGYLNLAGEMVIPLAYLEAGKFSEGLAAVKVNVDPAEETSQAPKREDSSHARPRTGGKLFMFYGPDGIVIE